MRKPANILLICVLVAGLLVACVILPGIADNAPTAVVNQSSQPQATQAALLPGSAAPLPSNTAIPPTPAPAPTQTRIPGPAIKLDQIHMLDTNNGWGWASKDGQLAQLLRTTDGGQTWLDVTPHDSSGAIIGQGQYSYYDSFFLNPNTAWLTYYDPNSNSGGLLHTKDGGSTWSSLPPNQYLQNARVQFSSPTDGVAETADLGAGNAHLTYYQTQDEGNTWKLIPIAPPTPEEGLPLGTIHLCNICGDSLYYDPARIIITQGDMASDPVGVVRLSVSTDLGQHWNSLQLPLPDKYSTGSVAPISPTFFGSVGIMPVNIIKYGTDGSLSFSVLVLYSTQDGGQTWQPAQGVLENQHSQINNVLVLSANHAFVRCNKNLCSTSDAGQTWKTLPDNLNFDESAGGPDYVSLFDFVDPSNGWAISGDTGATTLWQSRDGGSTWNKLAPTLIK